VNTQPKQELVSKDAPEPKAALTPMGMIALAVQQGADVERLQKLLELQERWEATEARKAFVVALTAFKAAPPTVTKNRHVAFGTTAYDHATLDQVSAVIGKALSEHHLSHRWEVEQKPNEITVTCVLTHEKGHAERVSLSAPADTSGSKNSIQAIGSTVTYLQRYSLLAATGLATKGQDDDGVGGGGAMAESQRLDFEAAIDALADTAGAEVLWKKIAAACKESGDREAYNALKARIAAKGKALKAKK